MLNFFTYAMHGLKGVFVFLLSVLCTGLLQPAGADATFEMSDKADKYEARAEILTASYEKSFFDKASRVLHGSSQDLFSPSGCWDLTALLTVYTKMTALDPAYAAEADRVIYALGFYSRQGDGFTGAYTGEFSVLQHNAKGDVYYDDNMWIGRDLVTLYELTGEKKYLERACAIADMLIAEGWDDLEEAMFTEAFGVAPGGPLGGFYWRSDHDTMNVCSNGPGIQFLAKLSSVADNGKAELYLDYAQRAYRFLRYLEHDNGTFWDLMKFQKDENNRITGIDIRAGASYSYNSGTPISSAVELYQHSKDPVYLAEAKHWADSADAYFARSSDVEGLKTYTDLPWFREVLLMGYLDLYAYEPAVLEYIQNMERAINYGYETHRLKGVLGYQNNAMPVNWVNGFGEEEAKRSVVLEQLPCAGIYASLALFYGGLRESA